MTERTANEALQARAADRAAWDSLLTMKPAPVRARRSFFARLFNLTK